MDSYVRDILETDNQYRRNGVEGDLHRLDEISFDKSWDYSLPTLTHDSELTKLRAASRTSESFRKRFFADNPIFEGISLDNLLVAGGCVGDYLISDQRRSSGDIDVFIYGLSPDGADARLKQLLQDLIDRSRELHINNVTAEKEKAKQQNRSYYGNEEHNMSFLRNKNGITIDETIQIIFRLYRTKSEILHGFDLGSSAVGFDGQNVYMTSLGRFSYEYRCNIIDTTRRSTTYENRLNKYFERGFDIIFPNLDMSLLRTHYHKYNLEEVCELPYFQFGYRRVEGNKIIFSRFYYQRHYHSDIPRGTENVTDYSLDDLDEYQAFYHNLYSLIHDRDMFYYMSNQSTLEILTKGPYLSWRNIQNFYDGLKYKLYDSSRLLTGTLNRYFPVRPVSRVMIDMFATPGVDQIQYINDLVDEQKNEAKRRMDVLMSKDHSHLPWITENPGTQLTSSFNPIFETPQKWYGDYYTVEIMSIPPLPPSHDDTETSEDSPPLVPDTDSEPVSSLSEYTDYDSISSSSYEQTESSEGSPEPVRTRSLSPSRPKKVLTKRAPPSQ